MERQYLSRQTKTLVTYWTKNSWHKSHEKSRDKLPNPWSWLIPDLNTLFNIKSNTIKWIKVLVRIHGFHLEAKRITHNIQLLCSGHGRRCWGVRRPGVHCSSRVFLSVEGMSPILTNCVRSHLPFSESTQTRINNSKLNEKYLQVNM